MRFPRASGVLLHPTSLPGPLGVGDLGPRAYDFIDFLASAGLSLWQILPLGPTELEGSPYAAYSAFAGNPMLISPELLVKEGLLTEEDLEPLRELPQGEVDFNKLSEVKREVLTKAFRQFRENASESDRQRLWAFCQDPLTSQWLEDFALFVALRRANEARAWVEWDEHLAGRNSQALEAASKAFGNEMWQERFLQWKFATQWGALRQYAHKRGVAIIGDMPIYVSDDSADVWSHPHYFHLDERGHRTVVAGVPPDYFSKTGQLWGNPLYRWDVMERNGFAWWLERFEVLFSRVDRVRLDHFRGFEAFWEIPAAEKTAVRGRWVNGPGHSLFRTLEKAFRELPILAEDLGVITPEVDKLRNDFRFPGMKILQFAFGGGPENAYLPHNYEKNCVVFTGTHDNDTTRGWLEQEKPAVREALASYLGTDGKDLVWDLIRLAQASVADQCIVPMQDLLELDTTCRMNTPGTVKGNWRWRMNDDAMNSELAARLRRLSSLYGRCSSSQR